jgi:hypothetical protein
MHCRVIFLMMRTVALSLLFLAAVTCGFPSYSAYTSTTPSPTDLGWDTAAANARAVGVRPTCAKGGGSGVAIDATRVITAQHVVACVGVGHPGLVEITVPGDDAVRLASVVRADPARDIAVLEVAFGAPLTAAPPALGPVPKVGSVVCHLAVNPWSNTSCGIVEKTKGKYGAYFTSVTVPGNSGGGLYDATTGDLVGVVVRYSQFPVKYHGGVASPILPMLEYN